MDETALLHHAQEVGFRFERVSQTRSFSQVCGDVYGRQMASATLTLVTLQAAPRLLARAKLVGADIDRILRGAPVMSTGGAPSGLPAPIAGAPGFSLGS